MFADALLAWYEGNRRSLPWRGETDPYKIWVSEIILQQTRVQQGWNYYLRFMEMFPDVESLARATEQQVLRVWQGLGYYSRARNMHAAALQVMNMHQGRFPDKYDDIRQLKGVGDYTAAAIASIAFGLPYPAVDGNVLRIISRIYGIADDIAAPATRKTITRICQDLMPTDRPGDFNQACMEFGAIWCTPRTPRCPDCPFANCCHALKRGLVEILPVKGGKIAKKERFFHFFLHIYQNCIVLEKRTGRDIWKNLYQLPLSETDNKQPLPGEKPKREMKEVLTHQVIHAKFYVRNHSRKPKLEAGQILVPLEMAGDYPMPKIMVEFLREAVSR